MDATERIEEEMCDEERYKDMFEDMKRVEEDAIEVERSKRGGAAIGFSYEDTAQRAESSSSEEEIDEPYQVPEGIKLPVGLELPKSLKQSMIIDKTATFVVKQGPQMEIVIKAKQRKNIDQFAFLQFDHILNPYYKYICKLIREQKYTPKFRTLEKRAKPKKIRRLAAEQARKEREEAEAKANEGKKAKNALEAIAAIHGTDSEEGTSDEESGYLHPMLRGGAKIEERSTASPIGPMPKPPTPKRSEPDLLEMIKRDYQLGKSNDVYSSLFKNLSDMLPQKETPKQEEATEVEQPSTSSASEELELETNEELIQSYNEWHMAFYGRHSQFYPGPPPRVIAPPPGYIRAVQAAASYVAQHGPDSEQVLLDHNQGQIEFMIPSSRYYTFYQAQVRFHHYHIQKHVYEMSRSGFESHYENQSSSPAPSLASSTEMKPSGSDTTPISRRERRRLGGFSRMEVEQPKVIDPIRLTRTDSQKQAEDLPDSEAEPVKSEETEMQMERKERAKQFMERILKERLAKKKQQDVLSPIVKTEPEPESAREQREFERAKVVRERRPSPHIEQAKVIRELKPDVISSLIQKTIEKALPAISPMAAMSLEKGKKENKEEKREKREKHRSSKKYRRRSSSYSSDEERERKKRRRHRNRSRSRSRSSSDLRSGRRLSKRRSRSRKRSSSRSRR